MKTTDTSPVRCEAIAVFDLKMASAYYACVFDAELGAEADMAGRDMMIGDRRYHLIHDKAAVANAERDMLAPVLDVDVSIARVATKGGRIVEQPAITPAGVREGRVVDPFGHSWRVSAQTHPI
ncbi:MAG: VOC family protein [Pseudomonadota bacterium]